MRYVLNFVLSFVLLFQISEIYCTTLDDLESHLTIPQDIKRAMRPHCLPENHHLQSIMRELFSDPRMTDNENSLIEAGFTILYSQPTSYIRVVRHPLLPGYLLKLYLEDELRKKDELEGYVWLLRRCIGAENVRKLIKRKKLKYFTVPDKWLYPLPIHEIFGERKHPIILIVEDMELASDEETKYVWKHEVKEKHLLELYCILSHGYSSCYLATNIPYSRRGKFACIDTEHPKRKLKYNHVKAYLSKEMKLYWQSLIDKK